MTVQELTLSWAQLNFNASGSLDPSNLTLANATWTYTSFWTASRIRGLTNQTLVNYTVTEKADSTLLYTAMPYRRVCFSAQTSTSTIVICYRIYINLKPAPVTDCSYTSSLNYYAQVGYSCPYKPLQTTTTIAVGQTFEAFIYFQDLNRVGLPSDPYADRVQIALLSDPGLPNGATLDVTRGGPPVDPSSIVTSTGTNMLYLQPSGTSQGSATASNYQQIYLYSRKLSFTPSASQTLTYSICVTATTSNLWSLLQANQQPTRQCYTIIVAPPSIMVDTLRTDFAPQRVPALSPTTWPLRVGCTYTFTIAMYEALDFGTVLDGFPLSAPAAGYVQGTYQPVAVADAVNPLPSGAVLSAATSIGVCADRSLGCARSSGPVPAYYLQVQTLTWTPQRGSENQTVTACLRLRDRTVAAGSTLRCVGWQVAMCQVCATGGDTLASIARAYGTDWLQLWGANSALTNPNGLALPYVLTLGPVYVNPVQQSAALLAKLFAMDLASLLAVNPTLDPAGLVPAGAAVCIMSTVCT